jgi:alpha-tubulin suppressor-like RCC1 family protein
VWNVRIRTRRVSAVLAVAGLAGALVTAGAAVPAAAAPAAGLFTWGDNSSGQVGNGTLNQQNTPTPISLPVAAVQVAGGNNNSAAVLSNGTLATWGYEGYGAIGNGSTSNTSALSPVVVPGLTGITQVAIGGEYMLALDSSGRVWSWGYNGKGQLGNGTTSTLQGSNPTPVPVPGLTSIIQISAGTSYGLALRSDGTVWAWGDNSAGQLGDGTTAGKDRAQQVPGLFGVTKVIAGYQTSYAIQTGGTLMAWGDNSVGLLGNGTSTGISATPVPVPGLTGVTQLSSTFGGTLAVVGSSGTMWSWGANGVGQLADGTTNPHYTPAPTSLTGVIQVAAADAAVLSSGKLMTWGPNEQGELGNGGSDQNAHPTPALVATLAGVTQVAFGAAVLAIGSPAPRIPSVISDTQSEASQALQAAGFVLGRVGLIVDLTCDYIGEVKTQSPAAGTIAQPGTAVNVGIGKVGGKCL